MVIDTMTAAGLALCSAFDVPVCTLPGLLEALIEPLAAIGEPYWIADNPSGLAAPPGRCVRIATWVADNGLTGDVYLCQGTSDA